jgi:hypothetical protein
VTHLLERVNGALQIGLLEAARDSGGPLDLTVRNGVKRRAAARREPRKFRSLVCRILCVRHETVGFEEISGPLNALAREPHLPADLGDRPPFLVEGTEHLPARAGLAKGTRQRIPDAEQAAIQSKDFKNQLGQELVRGSPHMTEYCHI